MDKDFAVEQFRAVLAARTGPYFELSAFSSGIKVVARDTFGTRRIDDFIGLRWIIVLLRP